MFQDKNKMVDPSKKTNQNIVTKEGSRKAPYPIKGGDKIVTDNASVDESGKCKIVSGTIYRNCNNGI